MMLNTRSIDTGLTGSLENTGIVEAAAAAGRRGQIIPFFTGNLFHLAHTLEDRASQSTDTKDDDALQSGRKDEAETSELHR